MNVHTYVGMRLTKHTVHQPLFNMEMWFDPHGIPNILSLAIINKHYHVGFYSAENFFAFHIQDMEIVFRQSEGGLYNFDIEAEEDFGGAILTYFLEGTPNKT